MQIILDNASKLTKDADTILDADASTNLVAPAILILRRQRPQSSVAASRLLLVLTSTLPA